MSEMADRRIGERERQREKRASEARGKCKNARVRNNQARRWPGWGGACFNQLK
jgi:hypothetical protein